MIVIGVASSMQCGPAASQFAAPASHGPLHGLGPLLGGHHGCSAWHQEAEADPTATPDKGAAAQSVKSGVVFRA
ncbi:exported hypothetical protein [Cupriavidus taiwanensis]|nr:exported hypothetical protein [Cupriavidus taiwanensis]SOZ88686.1 exported hypothetical protein [Cupriavidus taiwanensis]SOZ93950.1 exported hypothetical protein [Cupriavidus taiwanensis]